MSTLTNIGSQTISGAYGFELRIRPGQRTVFFPDFEILRNKRIKHIDVCDEVTDVLSGLPLLRPLKNVLLTLRRMNTQINIVDNLPLLELCTSEKQGNRLCFDDVFDIPASYITLPTDLVKTESAIYFVFWFDEPSVANVIAEGSRREISYFELQLDRRRTYFPENRTLYRKKFQSLLLSFPEITAENKKGILAETAYKTFLTLQRVNLQFMQAVPLYLFYQIQNAYLLNFHNVMFDFTNSFIDIANPEDEDYKTVFFNCIVTE